MKGIMMKKWLVALVSIMVLSSFISCRQNTTKPSLERLYKGSYEAFDTSMIQKVSMNDLSADTDTYLGSFIETEGKIISLCSVGCFFYIQDDDNNRFYVNLSPKGFDVPQTAMGKRVRVMGIFEKKATTLSIVAYEVEFLDVNP
jgi:hypothetical protein